jgi:hypothetical protein
MAESFQDVDASLPADASKQIYNIKDLTTKSVTLYSTRAHVTREINNVRIRPGANEVEIVGLSPTVDEHSIQIEGQGNATIVDMTVQLVPNRDIFEEIYPEDSDVSDDESDDEFQDSDDEEDAVKTLSEQLKSLQWQIIEANETKYSSNQQLSNWDRYAKTVESKHLNPDEVSKLLKKYEEDRVKIFEINTAADKKLTELKKQLKRKEHEKVQAGKEALKRQEKAEKQKAKEQRSKELKKAEKRKEAKYLKQERMRYWAKKVYKITLLLESASLDTPGSSRRNSLDTVTLASTSQQVVKSPKSLDGESNHSQPVSLLLSYVTKEAGWSPRYDLRISSVQKTATIIYRTEFLNRTSETWKDAKVSFSTSQTSYAGLDDVVPFMHAWHIKLSRYQSGDGGLLSLEEGNKPRAGRVGQENFNRADVFGLDDSFIPAWHSKRPLQVQQQQQQATNTAGLFGSSHAGVEKFSKKSSSGFRHTDELETIRSTSNEEYGYGAHSLPQARGAYRAPPGRPAIVQSVNHDIGVESSKRLGGSLFRGRRKESTSINSAQVSTYDPTIEDVEDNESDAPDPLDFEETSWEDNGLTATYDVPGTRTLEPSSLTRRHKIATLHAANIHLSHICVPKLRSAAFLRTKIRNPSSTVTLLKGSAGVTLDGSFLGNMKLPRVSPNQVFDLPLGVDPAIHVNYPKPSVHRSTQGLIFNKESAQVFSRSIWLNNTKSAPVDMLVLDQLPVSEDERLRIGIVTPRGLAKEGDSVKAGVSAKEGASGAVTLVEKDKKPDAWGTAVAKWKKNGELGWTVKLEGGKGCLLKLEYEARLPPAESIVPA